MISCPRCRKDLPDDSDFCQYCGKSITDLTIEESPDAVSVKLKENPRKNELGKYAILLMIATLLIFEFGLNYLFSLMGIGSAWLFRIAFVLYLLSIALAVFSLYVDNVDRKNGYEPSGNSGYAVAAITMSFIFILLYFQSGVMK